MKINRNLRRNLSGLTTIEVIAAFILLAVAFGIGVECLYYYRLENKHKGIRASVGSPISDLNQFDSSVKTVIGVFPKNPLIRGPGQCLFVTKSHDGIFKIWDINSFDEGKVSVGDIVALERKISGTNIVVVGRNSIYPPKPMVEKE